MQRYNPKDIEPKWQKIWDETGAYTADLESAKPKYIAMSMFNYPSGAGIHIGHAMNYTISDVKSRFKRQQGFESYHPVGWDSFGLPAENYAIKAGVSPQESMANIIPMYHKQYKAMGWSNDWEKEIATHLPEYYKWSQWIFTQMHKHGLAYQDSRMQWWCSIDKSVLADEQVIDGKCWRHDSPDDPPAEKREVKQWFFRITDYADELLEATDKLDWTEGVKVAQKNWIGRSEGIEVTFKVKHASESKAPNFLILHGFTGRADKNFLPSLQRYLEAAGYKAQVPQMPDTDNPTVLAQVDYVLRECEIDENTVVIGHSLGGCVAMKLLEKLGHPVRQLVLVAPAREPAFSQGDDRVYYQNFDFNYDYKEIVKKANKRIILSDTLEAARRKKYLEYLAPKIQAELIETTAKHKHFTAEEEPFVNSIVLPNIKIFTTAHDTIYGTTFMVLAPEHELVNVLTTPKQRAEVKTYIEAAEKKTDVERQTNKDKTGVFTGTYAVNPINGEEIPIWVADYVLSGYGTGAIMAVPGEDERDHEFAEKFGLEIIYTTEQSEFVAYENIKAKPTDFRVANSQEFNGLTFAEARPKILAKLEQLGVGTKKVNYKMRDWSVSRQRYWGAPIPVIHCPKDGALLVPDEDLPVVLPELDDFSPTGDGRGALARAKDWLEVECPKCGGPAERDTDTLDTYVDSSWYMYRYFDPRNQHQIFNDKIAKKWEPIDFYNGADHATAHLLYARFMARFFHKLGLINHPEPFKQFLFNGKVTAQDGKMFSKSKGNGIDPLEIIDSGYGADALRTYLMFAAPLELWVRWDPQGVPGTHRFLSRVWNLVTEYLETEEVELKESEKANINRSVHGMIKKVTEDLENNRYNTAIAAAMAATNDLYKFKAVKFGKNEVWQQALANLVAVIAPFAPHISEELWHQLGHSLTVHKDTWPEYDEKYLVQDEIMIAIQVNGKLRGEVKVAAEATEEIIVDAAKAHEKVAIYLKGQTIRKTIYVPGKLVNFVT
jgi:leucyl-tRNA synthetase